MLIERKKTSITKVRICDICENRTASTKCSACEKDLCKSSKCREVQYKDIWSQSDAGDYPPSLCINCALKQEKYADQIQKLHKDFDAAIYELEQKWLRECEG